VIARPDGSSRAARPVPVFAEAHARFEARCDATRRRRRIV
jgi:hypothetical protein